jgi:chromosome segregation ATPase
MEKVILKPTAAVIPSSHSLTSNLTKRKVQSDISSTVSKIQKVFQQRDAASRALQTQLQSVTKQYEYLDRQTSEINQYNGKLSSRKDLYKTLLSTLKEQIKAFSDDEVDPLIERFQGIKLVEKEHKNYLNEMESDLSYLANVFNMKCLDEIKSLLLTMTQLSKDRDNTIAEINQLTDINQEYKVQNRLKREEVVELARKQSNNEDALIELTQMVDSSNSELSKKQEEVQNLQEHLNDLIRRKQYREEEQENENLTSKANFNIAQAEAIQLNTSINSSRETSDSYTTKSKLLSEQSTVHYNIAKELNITVVALMKDEKSLQSNLLTLKADTESAKERLEKSQAELKNQLQNADKARDISDNLETQIASQQQRMSNAVQAHEDHRNTQNSLYFTLQSEKENLRTAIKVAKQKANHLSDATANINYEMKHKAELLNNLQSDNAVKSTSIEQMKKQLSDLQQSSLIMEEKLLKQHQSIASSCVAKLQDDVKVKEKELKLTESNIIVYEQQLQDLREACKSSQTVPKDFATYFASKSVSDEDMTKLAESVRIAVTNQEKELESKFQQDIFQHVEALNELRTGNRLEQHRQRHELKLRKLQDDVYKINQNFQSVKQSQEPVHRVQVEAATSGKKHHLSAKMRGFTKNSTYQNQQHKAKGSTSKKLVPNPVSPMTTISASPGDWFEDSEMW